MKKATLFLTNVNLIPSQIHKFRGCIGNIFKDYDIVHNHNSKGKSIYRYPLIQFKLINKVPVIIAITEEASNVLSNIFRKIDNIKIDNTIIPIFENNFKIENVNFGYSSEMVIYKFNSPWISLNSENYKKYIKSNANEKDLILKKILIGNILSMSKCLNHWLEKDQKIKVNYDIKEKEVFLKGKSMIGFEGIFKTNFLIPDYLGIGKSISRGFGSVKQCLNN